MRTLHDSEKSDGAPVSNVVQLRPRARRDPNECHKCRRIQPQPVRVEWPWCAVCTIELHEELKRDRPAREAKSAKIWARHSDAIARNFPEYFNELEPACPAAP